MKKLLKSKKALSPVISMIILIAVTVAVSIAVAAWMGALTFSFTKTESLSITGYTTYNSTAVTLTVSNTGSSTLTIVAAKIDNVISTKVLCNGTALGSGFTMTKGSSATISIWENGATTMSSGVYYNFELDTKAGNAYVYSPLHP